MNLPHAEGLCVCVCVRVRLRALGYEPVKHCGLVVRAMCRVCLGARGGAWAWVHREVHPKP